MDVEGPANENSYSNSILMVFGFIVQQSEAINSYPQAHITKRFILLRLFRKSFSYIVSNIDHRSTYIFIVDLSILFNFHCWFIVN